MQDHTIHGIHSLLWKSEHDTTIVNGKVVVQNGQLLTQDTEEIRKKAHQVACEIVQKERGLKKVIQKAVIIDGKFI